MIVMPSRAGRSLGVEPSGAGNHMLARNTKPTDAASGASVTRARISVPT